MKKIDTALILLTLLILMLMITSFAAASNWQQAQVTLVQGQATMVVFDNPDNVPIVLMVSSISAPDSLIPYLFVSPTTIPENSSREVTFQFVHIPQEIRGDIPPDVYALRVSGGNSNLLVYLDLSTPLPENAENRWAEIEARIDAQEASLMAQIEGAIVRIVALESAPRENWLPMIENLRENVKAEMAGLRVELAEVKASIPENSPPIDVDWVKTLVDNRATELRTSISSDIANLEIDRRLAEAREENERLRYEAYAAIAVAIVAVAIAIRRPNIKKPPLKIPKRGPPPKKKEISPVT